MRTEDGYIIQQCLDGDAAAFGLLVEKYKKGIYALAYSKIHNFHDAQDITQEAFIKAYGKLRTLRRWDNFMGWLYRITSNLCKDWLRSSSRRPDGEFVEDQDPGVIDHPSVDSYRENVMYESVREALDSLPEIYREVLALRYFGGMTIREISRFLGVSPGTIDRRLSGALARLKEEIPIMMSATYEQHELPGSFTFRIVEAVKRIRIHPAPRTTGLPWGLSLATGIIFTILSLTPQPGILNRLAAGSQLPGEAKVLRTGEIPVDILKLSEVPVLANKQGEGDSGDPELPDQEAANLVAANSEGGTRMQGAASDKGIIIDPKTGVKYTKTKTLVGKNDVIKQYQAHLWSLSISPNGKFLLWGRGTRVIPLDGGEPFDLVDMDADCGVLSPDGKKVVFYSGGAIWVISVSPETGRPTGPAEKLLDGKYGVPRWSPDSERIVFGRRDEESLDDIWTLSVKDGTLTQITDDPIYEASPTWSPDGKTIAYQRGYEIQVIPAEGGTSRKIIDSGRPISWSPDGEWLIYMTGAKFRLFRLADGREFDITPPGEVGTHFAWTPDGKMLFYNSSYHYKSSLKVVPVSGGQSFELGRRLTVWPYTQFWSPDSGTIITTGQTKDGHRVFWIIPLAGSEPFPLELDVSVPGEASLFSLSPDCRKLLFSVEQSENTEDLWVVPVSLKDGRTTGPAVMVFSGRDARRPYSRSCSWSPDGTRLAVIYKDDIWIASAEGGEPVQLTKTRKVGFFPTWSPGGEMIAYRAYYSQKERPLMVISASGGEPRKVLDTLDGYAWSPDGKELAFISEGFVLAIPIAGGKTRQVLDLKELGVDEAYGICWSPDGQHLAFIGSSQIFMVPTAGGEITKLADDDHGDKYDLYWSPDGKWLSYNSDGIVKTRPEGEIWEADVSELLSGAEKEQ